jgi:thioredoxin reductase (NADPH)
MPKPVLLTLDDDAEVLRAVERDLRSEYGSDYRVVRANSGDAALGVLDELKRRNEPPALFLVDQRMPGMSGVQFLERASAVYPKAKRVLLTAYADTDAAIRAINDAHVDYYLLKPWDPPEEKLYPVLSDLLEDWSATAETPFDGVRVIGHRFSAGSHGIRDFLTRNQVPYRWLDAEDEEAERLLEASAVDTGRLPVLLFPDGSTLVEPTTAEVAERVGLKIHADLPFYDLIIVGGGPAGLAAAVYGGSEGLRTVMVEREATGGQAGQSARIENYLGFPSGLSGSDLARRASTQARRFGAELVTAQDVTAVDVQGQTRIVKLADGSELASHTVLIATGVSYRRLAAPGIDDFVGAGVYYGAAPSEAAGYADQDVFVVGGANSAGQAALYLSGHARTVTVLYRGDALEDGMSHYLVEQIANAQNVNVRLGTEVVGAKGNGQLESVTLRGGGSEDEVPAAALFVFIGAMPRTDWLGDSVSRNERGFVLSGPQALRSDGSSGSARNWPLERDPFLLETSVPGVFVAGDVREQSIKRVASAVGEGAMAVQFIHQYLSGL